MLTFQNTKKYRLYLIVLPDFQKVSTILETL